MIDRIWIESSRSHPSQVGHARKSRACLVARSVRSCIDDRCFLPYLSIENDTTSLVPLNIIKSTKRLSQHLEHIFWLSLFKLSTELIIHCSPQNATYCGTIVEPLQISISNRIMSIRTRLLGYRICKDVQDLLML